MQHQMILLEEGFAALAHMRPERTAAVRMATMVLQQAVLRCESFPAAGAEVGLRLLLRRDRQNDRLCLGLLLLLLLLLCLLLLHLLLLHLLHLNLGLRR